MALDLPEGIGNLWKRFNLSLYRFSCQKLIGIIFDHFQTEENGQKPEPIFRIQQRRSIISSGQWTKGFAKVSYLSSNSAVYSLFLSPFPEFSCLSPAFLFHAMQNYTTGSRWPCKWATGRFVIVMFPRCYVLDHPHIILLSFSAAATCPHCWL